MGWFEDGAKDGFKIDGLQESAGNIPTGNGEAGSNNKFIMTPDQFLERYQEEYTHPDKTKALKGDVTAMVKYMRSIYAHEMDENALESLKIKITAVHTSSERIEMSKKMLSSDISKFNFKPSSYLEGQGYTINVKKDIFRFPSIILLDLAIVNDVWCSSTWDVPEVLKMEHRISGSLAKSLSFLLASGCFVRLEAYLHHGGHDDRISVAKELNKKAFEIRQTSNLANRRYFVPANLFFIICKHSIPLKDSFQHFELERALSAEYQADISWQSQTEVLYCTGRFTQALKIIKLQLSEQNSSLSDENLSQVLDRQCSLEHMNYEGDSGYLFKSFRISCSIRSLHSPIEQRW